MDDRIERCKQLDLKSVIEAYGGEFKKGMFSVPGAWGYEQSPSGKVYMKGGNQYFHHHKTGKHGDAIQFVQDVMGVDKSKAIGMLLGEEQHVKKEIKLDPISKAELQARELREKALKEEQDRKTLFAISKNSIPLIESNLACEYMQKRHISTAALTLNDPRIHIFENSFKDKEGKEQHQIGYLFQGNGKNSHRFMVLKGIDGEGNRNGFSRNLLTARPVFHQSQPSQKFIVTEGIEDALSALEMGDYKNFVSLNSTSSMNKLITSMNVSRKFFDNNSLEMCLDNDESGKLATHKMKVFTNIVSAYESNEISNLKADLKQMAIESKNPKMIEDCKNIFKIMNDTKCPIKDIPEERLISMVNSAMNIIPRDYFKDYGSSFNVKDSEYSGIMKELNINDLNDLLIKEYIDPVDRLMDWSKNNKEMER